MRRQERVMRIVLNKAAELRLIGAVLAEIHEQWQERKYVDMAAFHEWGLDRKTQHADKIISTRTSFLQNHIYSKYLDLTDETRMTILGGHNDQVRMSIKMPSH
jgi:hypothetical protein